MSAARPLFLRKGAQKLGISRSYVSRIEKKSLAALCHKFGK